MPCMQFHSELNPPQGSDPTAGGLFLFVWNAGSSFYLPVEGLSALPHAPHCAQIAGPAGRRYSLTSAKKRRGADLNGLAIRKIPDEMFIAYQRPRVNMIRAPAMIAISSTGSDD